MRFLDVFRHKFFRSGKILEIHLAIIGFGADSLYGVFFFLAGFSHNPPSMQTNSAPAVRGSDIGRIQYILIEHGDLLQLETKIFEIFVKNFGVWGLSPLPICAKKNWVRVVPVPAMPSPLPGADPLVKIL
jgi:hypothetical protein